MIKSLNSWTEEKKTSRSKNFSAASCDIDMVYITESITPFSKELLNRATKFKKTNY